MTPSRESLEGTAGLTDVLADPRRLLLPLGLVGGGLLAASVGQTFRSLPLIALGGITTVAGGYLTYRALTGNGGVDPAKLQVLNWTAPTLQIVQPGQTVQVAANWQNIDTKELSPSFRLAIKKTGNTQGGLYIFIPQLGTWIEGASVKAAPLAPGGVGTVVMTITIPGDWNQYIIGLRLLMGSTVMLEVDNAYVTDPTPSTAQFRNLEATYGNPLKVQGVDRLNTILTVESKGAGGTFDFGIGLAPAQFGTIQAPVNNWYSQIVSLPPTGDWTPTQIGFWDVIGNDVPLGLKDVLKWMQFVGGARNPYGTGYLIADWDPDAFRVIETPAPEFRLVLGGTYDGVPTATFLPKYQGQIFSATITFDYKGEGTFDVGVGFAPRGFLTGHNNVVAWVATTMTLPRANDWVRWSVTLQGVVPQGLPDNVYDILRFIQTPGGPRNPGGNGFLAAVWDDDVFDVQLIYGGGY